MSTSSWVRGLVCTGADEAKVRQLIADGFHSTSHKYRCVAQYTLPPLEEVLQPAFIGTELGKEIMRELDRLHSHMMRVAPQQHLVLTPGEFAAFKKLGGKSA